MHTAKQNKIKVNYVFKGTRENTCPKCGLCGTVSFKKCPFCGYVKEAKIDRAV